MPGKTGITLNTRAYKRGLRAFRRRSHAEAVQMNLRVGEALLSEGQRRAPIKTGFLKNSDLVVDESTSSKVAASIGFTADYAAVVHERTDVSYAQGEAKYLENAINQEGDRILGKAVDEMRRRLGT